MVIEGWENDFIATNRIARLGTVDPEGRPHVVPIVYAFGRGRLYTPIDDKAKRVPIDKLRRVRNISTNPNVAIIIDHYEEDWSRLVWIQIRGTAGIVRRGFEHKTGIELLNTKYSQYSLMPLESRPIVVVEPRRIRSWRAISMEETSRENWRNFPSN